MKTIKCSLCRIYSVMLLISIGIAASAQDQLRPGTPIGGIVVKGGRNPGGSMLLSFNGGTTLPGSNLENSDILGNGWNVNGNLYVPFWYRKTAGLFHTSIGMNVGFSYFQLKNLSQEGVTSGYNTLGQAALPLLERENDAATRAGYLGEGGLQANLSFGKITFSPILNIGYLAVQGSESKISQETTLGDQNYTFDLFSQKKEALKSVVLIPKLRISYFPGRIGLFAEANYTSGGEIKNTTSTFKPNGNPVRENYYDLKQMLAGQNETTETIHKFSTIGLNAGITISLGGEPAKANINTSRSNIKQQISTDDKGGNTDNPGEPAKANINTSRSNIKNQISANTNDSALDSVAKAQRVEVQDDFNTTRSNRQGAPQISMVSSGNSTGGIIVKGRKKSGGQLITIVTDEQGSFELKNLEKGVYEFSLTNPSKAEAQDFNTTRSNRDNRLVTNPQTGDTTTESNSSQAVGQAQDFNTTRSNKDRGKLVTNPHTGDTTAESNSSQAIGQAQDFNTTRNNRERGQLVTNPQTGDTTTESNSSQAIGQAQDFNTTRSNRDNRLVTNPQTGDTTTTSNPTQAIGQAQDFNTTRSNRERGQLVINPGNPIGGIIVKGGKNPGGQMKNLVVDDQGNIRFEVLEAGNYKFIIQTPETTDGNNQNAAGHWGDPHENLNGKHLKDLNNSERSKKLKSKHETAKNSISNVR